MFTLAFLYRCKVDFANIKGTVIKNVTPPSALEFLYLCMVDAASCIYTLSLYANILYFCRVDFANFADIVTPTSTLECFMVDLQL